MTVTYPSPRRSRDRRCRLSAALAGALALAVAVLVAFATASDGPERVDLGKGVAGVEPVPAVPSGAPVARAEPASEGRRATRRQATEREIGEGRASYYSDRLEGRPTASGEPYRGGGLTAAHRTLPFGSRLRVTNLANGRTVVVRVNDRGPFARRRVLDLSRAAAGRLGMLAQGHARVRLELLD
jgi:rare lipoprotein A